MSADNAEWARMVQKYRTEGSPGTKVFAITGRGRMSGVVEVEMGTTLVSVLENIVDGIRDGKNSKPSSLEVHLDHLLPRKTLILLSISMRCGRKDSEWVPGICGDR